MQNDWESKFYKELAEIKGIKDKARKIRSDFNKLSKRVGQIEIQGLQEQINSLNEALLKTNRYLACLHIHEHSMYLNEWIRTELSDLSRPSFSQAAEFLTTKSKKAHDAAIESSIPLSAADQFTIDCAEYFQTHGLQPYRDYP